MHNNEDKVIGTILNNINKIESGKKELDSHLLLVDKEKKTCTITIKSGDRVGYLYFKNGELMAAETNTLDGSAAALDIVSWDDVIIESNSGCKVKQKMTSLPVYLLLSDYSSKLTEYKKEVNSGNAKADMEGIGNALERLKSRQGEKTDQWLSGNAPIIKAAVERQKTLHQIQVKEDEMTYSKEEQMKKNKDGSMSRIVQLNKVLYDLKAISVDIEACAVSSEDGLIMASNLPEGLEESNVAAMCAVMLSMGERTVTELERGTAEQLFIKGDAGYVVAMRAGNHAVLLVMARKDAKLGLIFLDLSRAAKKVEQILS